MGSLLVVTGPPGSGKSTVAQFLASEAERSVLVEGDAFFGFLAAGAIEPWLPESSTQNEVVITAAATAAGSFATGGYTTVYDGVLGPWHLPTFGAATGLKQLDYVILLPDVGTCVQRVATRTGHSFTDEPVTRQMHAEFSRAEIPDRHVLCDNTSGAAEVAAVIQAAQATGDLEVLLR